MATLQNEYKTYHFLDLDDAHYQGFYAGHVLSTTQKPFKNPVNLYQVEYNRGYSAGYFFRQ